MSTVKRETMVVVADVLNARAAQIASGCDEEQDDKLNCGELAEAGAACAVRYVERFASEVFGHAPAGEAEDLYPQLLGEMPGTGEKSTYGWLIEAAALLLAEAERFRRQLENNEIVECECGHVASGDAVVDLEDIELCPACAPGGDEEDGGAGEVQS